MNKYLTDRLNTAGPGGCWLWTGCLTGPGYARYLGAEHRGMLVHRVIYEIFKGKIKGDLDHLCNVRHCCNPDHLEDVTTAENLRRQVVRGTHKNSKKTHCHKGHKFDNDNTYRYPDGRRKCRACRRDRERQPN